MQCRSIEILRNEPNPKLEYATPGRLILQIQEVR